MKKAHIWIIIIVIAVILVVISIWAIVYPYFLNRVENSTRQSFIDETVSYLSTEENFVNRYGLLISAESECELPIKNEASKLTEYYMDFICTTEKGQFVIRVYHTWTESWTYRFEEIDVS